MAEERQTGIRVRSGRRLVDPVLLRHRPGLETRGDVAERWGGPARESPTVELELGGEVSGERSLPHVVSGEGDERVDRFGQLVGGSAQHRGQRTPPTDR